MAMEGIRSRIASKAICDFCFALNVRCFHIFFSTKDDIIFKNIEIILYDIHGQEKLRQNHINSLNIEQYSSGIYFLKIVLDQQQIYTHKVIKQ